VGARFDDRATGKLSEVLPARPTLHRHRCARDPTTWGGLGIAADARACLDNLTAARRGARDRLARAGGRRVARFTLPARPARWHQRLVCACQPDSTPKPCRPDVGQHQMWARSSRHFEARRLLTSAGSALWASAYPRRSAPRGRRGRVICVSGDGSLRAPRVAARQLDLDVTILVLDSRHLGWCANKDALHGERLSAAHLPATSSPSRVSIRPCRAARDRVASLGHCSPAADRAFHIRSTPPDGVTDGPAWRRQPRMLGAALTPGIGCPDRNPLSAEAHDPASASSPDVAGQPTLAHRLNTRGSARWGYRAASAPRQLDADPLRCYLEPDGEIGKHESSSRRVRAGRESFASSRQRTRGLT
jgi:hypothetical protein